MWAVLRVDALNFNWLIPTHSTPTSVGTKFLTPVARDADATGHIGDVVDVATAMKHAAVTLRDLIAAFDRRLKLTRRYNALVLSLREVIRLHHRVLARIDRAIRLERRTRTLVELVVVRQAKTLAQTIALVRLEKVDNALLAAVRAPKLRLLALVRVDNRIGQPELVARKDALDVADEPALL